MPKHAEQLHISSAVVSVLPAHQDDIMHRLSAMSGVEVFHHAPGKIVIVLEGPDTGAMGTRLVEIACLSGVLSANMVFEQAATLAGGD
jgi:nitrate reductase NapD